MTSAVQTMGGAGVPKRVALVDDDGEFNEFLSEYLRGRGAVVQSFRDGESFLERSESGQFDAFIMDLTLPGLDGVDVIRRVRERESLAGILVISGRVGPDAFNLPFAPSPDTASARTLEALPLARITLLAAQRCV